MQDNYQQLIAKYFSGNITPEEESTLLGWVEEKPENKRQFDQSVELLQQVDRSFESFEPDTEEEWKRLKQKLIGPRVLWLNRGRWLKIAAAFIFIVGIGYVFQLTVNQENSGVIETREPVVFTQVDTPESEKIEYKEGREYMYLPDESKVYVSKGSDVTYLREDFGKALRTVSLKGEAFFEVAHDETKPFIVNGGKTTIKVLGTSFTYKVHEDAATEEVIVESGKVEFALKGSNEKIIVNAGRKGIYYKNSGKLKRKRNSKNNWLRNLGEKIRNLFTKEED